MKQKVVVISPTYNESGNIKKVTTELAKVFRALPRYDCHVLFVDDNSPDGTAKVINQVVRDKPWVHLLSNKSKGGLGHAYKKGMRYSLDKLHADIMFAFDADLSHDPSLIAPMLSKLASGSDMVLGARYVRDGAIPASWPPHRKFLSIMGNLFMRIVMGNFKIHDWTTGYRAIKSEVVENIIPQLNGQTFNGYTWQIGFLVKSIQAGFKIGEVPLQFKDREVGYSKLGPEYIFNTLRYIMKVRLSQIVNHRIFKFAVTGGLGALVQLVFLQIYRQSLPYQLAFFLAIETAIVSNFTLSNLWTFADRKLKAGQIPLKFVTFNLASGGSIIIQQIIALVGEKTIGLVPLFSFKLLAFSFTLDSGTMYAVVGILVGMFWNFFAYSRIIWKKK